MIKVKIEIDSYNMTQTEMAEEYKWKLPFFKVDLDLGINFDHSHYDAHSYLCVIVSVDADTQVINQIKGVSKKGKMQLNMIGRTNIDLYNQNTFWLAEVSFFDNKIIYIKKLMVLLDEIAENKYYCEDVVLSPDVMHKICISMLDYYVGQRFFTDISEMYMDGEIEINY